ncbi:MAG: hypothetical protein ABI565_13380, partial [Vicinamibacteria bacterium]
MLRFPAASVLLSALLAAPCVFALDDAVAVVPEHQGLIKRKIHAFMDDEADVNDRGLRLGPFQPGIVIPSSGAGLAPMLHLWAPDLGGSGLDFHASGAYSMYGYQYYDAQIGRIPHEGKRLPRSERGTSTLFPLSELEKAAVVPGFHAYLSARHRDYPREDFYGVGPNSLKANRTDYRLKDDFFEGVIETRVSRLSLMGRAGLLKPSIHPGTDSYLRHLFEEMSGWG